MVCMFFARGMWCVADISSVCPSSEKTASNLRSLLRRRANAQNVSYTPYPIT